MRRWLWFSLWILPVVVYGVLIGLAYRTPPLVSHMATEVYATAESGTLVGMGLINRGRWPLTLIDAQMSGAREVSAWISLLQPGSDGIWVAFNLAVSPEADRAIQPHRKKPVTGFRVEPGTPFGSIWSGRRRWGSVRR